MRDAQERGTRCDLGISEGNDKAAGDTRVEGDERGVRRVVEDGQSVVHNIGRGPRRTTPWAAHATRRLDALTRGVRSRRACTRQPAREQHRSPSPRSGVTRHSCAWWAAEPPATPARRGDARNRMVSVRCVLVVPCHAVLVVRAAGGSF